MTRTCKKLHCLLLGHRWHTIGRYEIYKQSIEGLSTGHQLFCTRSDKWVKVKYHVFEKYYAAYCRPIIADAPSHLDYEENELDCPDCGGDFL